MRLSIGVHTLAAVTVSLRSFHWVISGLHVRATERHKENLSHLGEISQQNLKY